MDGSIYRDSICCPFCQKTATSTIRAVTKGGGDCVHLMLNGSTIVRKVRI